MSAGFGAVGQFMVQTTQERGFTPEEISENLLDKIISVSMNAHPVIKEQAIAFKDSLRPLIVHYMKQAISSNRTTLAAQLLDQGHDEMARIIRRL